MNAAEPVEPEDDRARLADLQAQYEAAVDSEDVERQDAALRELVALRPDVAWAWFDLGLHAKWRLDWAESSRCNEKALALSTDDEGDPAAWNLGIAATALGDWATARRAWRAYGIDLPDGDGPIRQPGGLTPVRLNAEPRYPGQESLVLDGATYAEEVVWCERICPTRAVVRNVPTPDAGHRWGDVVLHDGEPVGERTLADGSTRPVFAELTLLERSDAVTWLLSVDGEDDPGAELLNEIADSRGGGAQEWRRSVRMLCRACSEGNPQAGAHDHEEAAPSADGPRAVGLGVAERHLRDVVEAWTARFPGLRVAEPERVR